MVKDLGLRGASRRDFVRGVFAASAALGLGPMRALDILEKMGGSALAQSAFKGNFMLNVVWGNGAQSMMTQMFPPNAIVDGFQAGVSSLDAPTNYGQIMTAQSKIYHRIVDGKPIYQNRPWTAFVAGASQAHSNFPAFANNPVNISTLGSGHLFSAASVLQAPGAALVPIVALQKGGNPTFAPAPAGSAAPALVANDTAMVGLFSSAASQLMTRLAPAANQALFSQYYTAFLGLAAWGDRPTYARAKSDAKLALSLVVKNLASQLQPAAGQAMMWGGDALVTTDAKYGDLAKTMIVALNAFKLGLTRQVVVGAFFNDPHGHFAQAPAAFSLQNDVLARILNSFQVAADAMIAPNGKKLGDQIIQTHHGDTTKTPFNRVGWGDGNGANFLYVQGQGLTRTGWVGEQLNQNSRTNFNPATGANDAAQPTALSTSAAIGATLFAVNGGNSDAIRPFFSGSIAGITNTSLTGA